MFDICFYFSARLERPREDIEFDWHMASGFWRSIWKISTVSCGLPRTQGTISFCYQTLSLPCSYIYICVVMESKFSSLYCFPFSCLFDSIFSEFWLHLLLVSWILISTLLSKILQAAGVDFPPREENSVPLFTPPQTQPLRHPHLYTPPGQSYEDAAIQASLQSAPPASALRLSFMCLPMWFLSSSLSDLVSFVSRSHHLCLMSKCWKEYHYTSIIILCWYFIFMLLSRLYLILLFFPCCSPCLIISKKIYSGCFLTFYRTFL
jgi:hypothetical protein